MTWGAFGQLLERFPLPTPSDHASLCDVTPVRGVTFGKSRMRESRTYGSVRAKAEWLSYSTGANRISPVRLEIDVKEKVSQYKIAQVLLVLNAGWFLAVRFILN